MNYDPDDFIALSNEVETQGGRNLLEPCAGHLVPYKVPAAGAVRYWKKFLTTHCDNSARMEIPYDAATHVRLHDDEEDDVILIDHAGEKHPKDQPAVVCAVDDCVGLWPRFAGVVSDKSYQSKGQLEKELEKL